MRKIKLIIATVAFTSLGCSVSASEKRCNELREAGTIYSTQESCAQCVDTLGPSDPNAIRGCAIGMDAARMISMGQ